MAAHSNQGGISIDLSIDLSTGISTTTTTILGNTGDGQVYKTIQTSQISADTTQLSDKPIIVTQLDKNGVVLGVTHYDTSGILVAQEGYNPSTGVHTSSHSDASGLVDMLVTNADGSSLLTVFHGSQVAYSTQTTVNGNVTQTTYSGGFPQDVNTFDSSGHLISGSHTGQQTSSGQNPLIPAPGTIPTTMPTTGGTGSTPVSTSPITSQPQVSSTTGITDKTITDPVTGETTHLVFKDFHPFQQDRFFADGTSFTYHVATTDVGNGMTMSKVVENFDHATLQNLFAHEAGRLDQFDGARDGIIHVGADLTLSATNADLYGAIETKVAASLAAMQAQNPNYPMSDATKASMHDSLVANYENQASYLLDNVVMSGFAAGSTMPGGTPSGISTGMPAGSSGTGYGGSTTMPTGMPSGGMMTPGGTMPSGGSITSGSVMPSGSGTYTPPDPNAVTTSDYTQASTGDTTHLVMKGGMPSELDRTYSDGTSFAFHVGQVSNGSFTNLQVTDFMPRDTLQFLFSHEGQRLDRADGTPDGSIHVGRDLVIDASHPDLASAIGHQADVNVAAILSANPGYQPSAPDVASMHDAQVSAYYDQASALMKQVAMSGFAGPFGELHA